MTDRPTDRLGWPNERPTNCNDDDDDVESKKPQQVAQPSSPSLSLSVAPWLMYKTLRALISYYSLFLYAIRTSISVFVVVHKKHISATTTTLRERKRDRTGQERAGQTRDRGTVGQPAECGTDSSKRPARCLLSARKSVYF